MSAPDRFQYERPLVSRGKYRVAGVDEAGRGPLAGPVLVAAVVFPRSWIEQGIPEGWEGLTDSKAISAKRREEFFEMLQGQPEVQQAIVAVEPKEIDEVNILQATHRGMVRALEELQLKVDHVLVDGLRVRAIQEEQTAIVKGDSKSYSIAAASVLAKVTRDRLMIELDRKYPGYGFAQHKGYPTAAHLDALKQRGPCPVHRMSYAPVRQQQLDLL